MNLEDGLTLEEALRLAMAHNPGLEAIRREMELARAQRLTAGQWPHNPELFGGIDRAFPLTGTEDSVVGGGLSQVFEIGGQRGYRILVAEANIERTQATVSDAERLVRADVATAFFENLMLDERTRLAIDNVEIAENLLEAAQARFEAKQIPEVDLNLVRLQHQRTKNESALVASRRRAARLRLAALLGEADRTEFALEGNLRNTTQEITRETALQTAWEYRADLKALRHQARMARAQIGLEKSQVWPTVELGAFYSYETLSIDNLSDRDHAIGIELTLPIPLLNRRQGEIAVARAVLRILNAAIADLLLLIERDVDLALNRLTIARETVELYEEQLNRLSRQNLEEFEKAYLAGEVGTLEVFRTQEDYNRVTGGYQEALFEYEAAKIELESALGGRVPQ